VTPSLPLRGKQSRGSIPLTPPSDFFYLQRVFLVKFLRIYTDYSRYPFGEDCGKDKCRLNKTSEHFLMISPKPIKNIIQDYSHHLLVHYRAHPFHPFLYTSTSQ